MDRGDVLSGAAFSAVLRSAFAFVVVLVLVGWAALSYVESSLIAELGDDVQQRWNIISAEHQSKGTGQVVETIAKVARSASNGRQAAALFNTVDGLIAGNVKIRPDGTGLQVGPLDHAIAPPEGTGIDYVYFSGPLDDNLLVVGQRLDLLYQTKILIFRALTISGFVIVLTMLSVGYYLSSKSLRRLGDIETTLSKTSEGDLEVRIPEHGGTTQIDRIARQMNLHLDRLSSMIVTTRNTAAAAAHDLKSPLGRAYLSLGKAIEKVGGGEDPGNELADTQDELANMRAIFDSYLQLSRIEAAGEGRLTTEIDLKDLASDLVETFALIAEDAGQSLSFEADTEHDHVVLGDTQMLQQMMVNLLQNAVTHGSEGNRITVSLHREEARILFTVADKGPGIPADSMARVFEPFHRLDPSRSKPGSGLGLALVRAIAEKHRGSVVMKDNHPGLIVQVTFPA